MKKRIKNFLRQVADTAKTSPAELFLMLFFAIFAILIIENALPWYKSETSHYLVLFPFAFTIAYLLNRWLKNGAIRWIYYISPIFILPFFWADISDWVESPAFWTAICICPALVIISKWQKDNGSFVGDALHYVKNGLFGMLFASLAYLMVVLIYFSIRYIFPSIPMGNEDHVITKFAAIFYFIVAPLVFLVFDRRQKDGYKPVAFFDILVNYVLTPALLIYTAILYLYFVTILFSWSLPKGGIANMVFIFAMIAVLIKSYRPLMAKRWLNWFYDRFSLISLPALIMFWIGVARRIGEYGFTVWRIYLLICGIIMTFTIISFIIPRMGRYLYVILLSIAMFSSVAFFPSTTAQKLAVKSQTCRFEATAARLGMLDGDGRLIVEKRPDADSTNARDYEKLYEAFSFLYYEGDSGDLYERYGISTISDLNTEILPRNISYGRYYKENDYGYDSYSDNYIYIYRPDDTSIDIKGFATLYETRYKYSSQKEEDPPICWYYNSADSLWIMPPGGKPIIEESFKNISERILEITGLAPGEVTEEKLKDYIEDITMYEHSDCRIILKSIYFRKHSDKLEITDIYIKYLLGKE